MRAIATNAAADPDNTYVLVIDEINRAQLQKVLGELFFLLEYRDREVRPLYRPAEPFKLPSNLWIIGTMNTADRSTAIIDAALRRRFQFVPFVPDERPDNPLAGLLQRWLRENDQPEWVAEFVDSVNQALFKELGGGHLILGPSYFMTTDLSEDKMRRIWRYRIEPLIEDIFFGEAQRAERFRFAQLWSEFGPNAGQAAAAVPGELAESVDGSVDPGAE